MSDVAAPPGETLYQLIMGFQATHLIGVAARFGLADLLTDGPKSSAALAALAGAHPDALHRILRALAELGVVAMLDDDTFTLTPVGMCLRTDAPGSLRAVTLLRSGEYVQRPYLALEHTVRTGETAFDHVFRMNSFDYLTAHPGTAAVFNDVMSAVINRVTGAIVSGYDFSPFGTIVDVGGGNGTLLTAILAACPGSRGVVFDLPHARDSALRRIETAGLASRCEFVGGDFFASVPSGADAYLLKWVIHDWDDERSAAILQTCRRAMAPGSKLLLIESLLPSGNEPRPAVVLADVHMMVVTGGRERTEAGYRALLEVADLYLVRTIATPGAFSVLEAEPVVREHRA